MLLPLLLTGAIAFGVSAAEKPKPSTRALTSIPGINEIVEAKLNAAGINNVNDLLAEGATPEARKEMAARSGLRAEQVLTFVNYADILRINGIGRDTAELLQTVGVKTAVDLAQSNASTLQVKLQQANEARKRKGKLPTEQQIAEWIEGAKTLPKLVAY